MAPEANKVALGSSEGASGVRQMQSLVSIAEFEEHNLEGFLIQS